MMKTTKTAHNREAYYIYRSYENSDIYTVLNAYVTTPSIYKINAENAIIQEMIENNGHGYKIISSNGFQFSCGYLVDIDGIETLVYHTKSNVRYIQYNGIYEG